MSPPAWLPPLNSHNSYVTYVSFRHIDEIRNFRSFTEDMFLIRVHASVQFTSCMNKAPFPGLYLKKGFYIPRRGITSSFSSSETEEILHSLCYFTHLPFQLDHIIFQQKDSGTSDHIKSIRDLAAIIQSFLYGMKSKTHSSMLPFSLEIVKSVEISDDQYNAWSSWYVEKAKADPNFEAEYKSAITRTRTDEELLHDNQALAFKTGARISTNALIKNVRIESHVPCLICLEQLLPQSKSTRLPCNHAFHEGCIEKWLQERSTCPLCRFLLPTN